MMTALASGIWLIPWWARNGILPGLVPPDQWRLAALLVADGCDRIGLWSRASSLRDCISGELVDEDRPDGASLCEDLADEAMDLAFHQAHAFTALLETEASAWAGEYRTGLEARREYTWDVGACAHSLFQMCHEYRMQHPVTRRTHR